MITNCIKCWKKIKVVFSKRVRIECLELVCANCKKTKKTTNKRRKKGGVSNEDKGNRGPG